MPITALSLDVVGMRYPNRGRKSVARRFAIDTCTPGDPVELRPEPENPVDPLAVAVFNGRGEMLGYLRAERCGWIGAMLRGGREVRAIFQASQPWGAVIRATLDGSVPTLPIPQRNETSESDHCPDFWPDPIYDDD